MTRLLIDADQIRLFVGAVFRYASDGQTISLRSFEEGKTERALSINPVTINGVGLEPLIETAVMEAQFAADHSKLAVFCPPLAGFSGPAKADEVHLTEGYTLSVECDQRPEEARQTLDQLLGPATLIVASGGDWADPQTGEVQDKLHLHWRLNEPSTGDDLVQLKVARRLAAKIVGGDPTNVSIVHPIRWPGSWHRKSEPKLARIIAQAENEIELTEALERLEQARPTKTTHQTSETKADHGDRQDKRSTAELIGNITSGREFHPSIIPLSARWIGGGMKPGFAVNQIRELLTAIPIERRDSRWQSRFDDVPRMVATAETKYGDDATPPTSLNIINASTLHGKPVPPRSWHVPGLIPGRTVTLLSGDGGTGKSLLALQLAASTAIGTSWLGLDATAGRALYVSAEDELDEMHRRLADICAAYQCDLSNLGDLRILPLAGEDAVLAAPGGRSNVIASTPLWRQLVTAIDAFKPSLVVFDTLADLFAGDENQRAQARQFIGLLRGLAMKVSATALVLAHPSLTGMASGTGSSGSTGWGNSVRSRLYFDRVKTESFDKKMVETDPDLRTLLTVKANYGRPGGDLQVRWKEGVFERLAGSFGLDTLGRDSAANSAFLSLLRLHERQGIDVSPKPSSSYAPTVFAAHTQASGITKRAFKAAMERLLDAGTIRVEHVGPPSRRTTRLTHYSADSEP